MLEKLVTAFVQDPKRNHISEGEAIDESVIGLKLFDTPIVGYADANDELFETFKTDHKITYGRFMPPKEWLKEAKTVISIFLPYSSQVKKGNSRDMKEPSKEWLHARHEGQIIIDQLSDHLKETLTEKGYHCVAPSIDKRLEVVVSTRLNKEALDNSDYGSNWSERHVAYAAGLGTFGLSKGLITRKGMAGRFTSIITDMEHEPTEREYKGVYDYCTMCGACIRNCPVGAITMENGKEHTPCSEFLDRILEKYSPRYACGKCQVKVPCENGIPQGRRTN
ncbi:4Fe-4S binding protein [Methanococcoides alaskense]|uniref:Epoxyqueuosine reductase QueG n=1 Tax=Methanococcoides alaskense TaxID=325778 RepID=A0AA90TZE1_9EURY|nr:4Fe-4S binding protein [Methanococcoides alaskense]MDA0525719.1 4Fe-4S binding protein [Methanococcoides alaskense]MDR6222945.1 epoxyqueuosine reductase QueG [Methanococcoides alaskense]